MIELDGATALRLLREVVAERPDYVYDEDDSYGSCRYVLDGKVSCIVGHVLARAGWATDVIAQLDNHPTSARDLPALGPVTEDAARILDEAQRVQDGCDLPWREALSSAEMVAAQRGVTS